jgi:GTP-binding protein
VIQTQQLTLPPSEFAKVRKAVYVSSSVDLRGCPPQSLPEFAVIGRSNVGKSSLINMLTQSNKLAKVSKQPGGLGSSVCAQQSSPS